MLPPEHPSRCAGVKPPVKQVWRLLLSLLSCLEVSKFSASIRSRPWISSDPLGSRSPPASSTGSLDGEGKVFSGQSVLGSEPTINHKCTTIYRCTPTVSKCKAAEEKVPSATGPARKSCRVERRFQCWFLHLYSNSILDKEEKASPQPPCAFSCLHVIIAPAGRPESLGMCSSISIHICGAKGCSSRDAEEGPCSGAIPGSGNDSLHYLGQITLKCVFQPGIL